MRSLIHGRAPLRPIPSGVHLATRQILLPPRLVCRCPASETHKFVSAPDRRTVYGRGRSPIQVNGRKLTGPPASPKPAVIIGVIRRAVFLRDSGERIKSINKKNSCSSARNRTDRPASPPRRTWKNVSAVSAIAVDHRSRNTVMWVAARSSQLFYL